LMFTLLPWTLILALLFTVMLAEAANVVFP
jgi:hypothetical protein